MNMIGLVVHLSFAIIPSVATLNFNLKVCMPIFHNTKGKH